MRSLSGARGWAVALLILLALAMLAGSACSAFSRPKKRHVPEFQVSDILVKALGGDTTSLSAGTDAFELSARNLTNEEHRTFEVGDSFFNQNWVIAPSSTTARDGLGPTLNAMSCSSCHTHDGRSRPPESDERQDPGLLIRLSIPTDSGAAPDPVYGDQLEDRAIPGVPAEGHVRIMYEDVPGQFADGTHYTLTRPVYILDDLAFGPLPDDVMVSARVAPAMIGLGLLQAIPESVLLDLADPGDDDGDGISGRPNMVTDLRTGQVTIGRFGWKAGQPSVEQQTVMAFNGDLGITSSLVPDENCPPAQTACAAAPNGGSPELSDDLLAKIAFYGQTLAVPAMRDIDDPQVQRGAQLFLSSGCASCHIPKLQTGESDIDALSNQTIFPYTDLLLHDMGPALADNRPEGEASGTEWRTAPLWGIGLVETVNGHTRFLHDGRARNLTEAILWHGGEAEKSKEVFRDMSADDRAALIRFLKSL